ncbi:hypothetical protein Angca_007435, partial [Angiostrongylus cantonensis]
FFRSRSSSQTILLTVFDSSTGQTLGECSETSKEAIQWTLFQWILKSDSMLCTILPNNSTRISFPHSSRPRTFSVRLHANHGPVCIRDLRVQDERPTGCPPHLISNSFKSQFLNCSCPFNVDNNESGYSDEKYFNYLVSKVPQFPILELVGSEPASQTSALSLPIISSCDNFVCLNNGTCVINQKGSAVCLCQSGFTGTACEVDLCSSSLCQNGGHCRANRGQAYCECPPAFTGVMCESVITTCDPPCMNGKCIGENGTTRCECDYGFIGVLCNVADVCLKNAVCDMFGRHAKCVVDKSNFNLTSSMLYNATYKCRCPHPINREFVDCLTLGLSTPVFESISNGFPSGMMSTAGMVGITSSSPNTDTTVSQREINDPLLLTTFSSLTRETEASPVRVVPSVIALTSTSTSQFPITSDSFMSTSFLGILRSSDSDASRSSIIPAIHPNFHTNVPMRLEEMENGSKPTTRSSTIETELHTEETSSLPATKYRNFLTPFTFNGSDGTTSSSPQSPSSVIPQSTIPFWMTVTVRPSEGHIENEEEGYKRKEHELNPGLKDQNSEDKRTTKVSMTAVREGGGQRDFAASWIVAVVAVIVLGLLLLATTVFVLRYVKQSRKLHGKYNPAREEYALSAAYSMPLSHVSKEERLI